MTMLLLYSLPRRAVPHHAEPGRTKPYLTMPYLATPRRAIPQTNGQDLHLPVCYSLVSAPRRALLLPCYSEAPMLRTPITQTNLRSSDVHPVINPTGVDNRIFHAEFNRRAPFIEHWARARNAGHSDTHQSDKTKSLVYNWLSRGNCDDIPTEYKRLWSAQDVSE